MPSKTLAKAGLVAVMVAILLPWTFNRWVKSRSFEPVNMLVSLEAGKVQVVEFAINIRESYSVRMEMDYSEDDWNEGKCPFRSWKDTDWKVYRLSGGAAKKRDLQASSAEMLKQGDIPDGFHGWPGKYQLEWTIPRASACLNARHPQLHVYASSSDYQEAGGFLLFACVFLGGTGIVLILRALGAWVHGYLFGKRPLRMFPGVILRNVIPLQRHRPMALIKDPPNFGLVYGCIL